MRLRVLFHTIVDTAYICSGRSFSGQKFFVFPHVRDSAIGRVTIANPSEFPHKRCLQGTTNQSFQLRNLQKDQSPKRGV